ncbi:ABC transporter permease subunit [bacterium]|nr:ABC transporter permease subunit [bacterium]
MRAYFIRRFLLIIPTFIGITLLSFIVMQFVPGGPVEQAIMQIKMGAAMSGEGGATGGNEFGSGNELPEEALKQIREYYGFDKPFYVRYWNWLCNVVPLQMKYPFVKWPNLGTSYKYQEPVWDLFVKRFPISIYFGLVGFTLSYLVCIPLGVFKAIKHGSAFDAMSSMIVFIGYSIPGWAMGVILLVMFGGGSYWSLFPLGGFRPDGWSKAWDAGRYAWCIKMQLWHTVLPVCCYMVGSFATLTVLMKNSLMENLGKDYIRTAFAKGLGEKVVIFKHGLRNSLIPIATGLGHLLSLVIAGSYLIEKVFNIDGIGLLGYTSIVQRDYPVAMGMIVIASLLKLFGNIVSDALYCLIDPRIRFS